MTTFKASDFKQRAHALIDRLPEDAGWKDLAYEVSIIQDIEAGLADSDVGRVAENSDVRRRFGLPEVEMLAASGGPLNARERAAADTALGIAPPRKRKRQRK